MYLGTCAKASSHTSSDCPTPRRAKACRYITEALESPSITVALERCMSPRQTSNSRNGMRMSRDRETARITTLECRKPKIPSVTSVTSSNQLALLALRVIVVFYKPQCVWDGTTTHNWSRLQRWLLFAFFFSKVNASNKRVYHSTLTPIIDLIVIHPAALCESQRNNRVEEA